MNEAFGEENDELKEKLDRISKIRVPSKFKHSTDTERPSSERPSKRSKTAQKGKKPVRTDDDENESATTEGTVSERGEPKRKKRYEKDEQGARVCLKSFCLFFVFQFNNYQFFSDFRI